ncbi:pyridoxamine 5'-phosphate oxidase family protein [Halobacillus sp. BBL2006]|uniref:pyridoxamine 5'-phosphate oxidase family protein n=1 Tax=Halobacillus sp. BBL2006 TaxID=1543706 RepID=UPI0005440821|nr:pyridoxamine 5'-phosphate oxidase family protein [Halobacillus sp. BBL2006]KHE67346.1 phosphohydrolase [Halobacillus sp. BBL2006]
MKNSYQTVSTVDELEQLQGTPGRLAANKVIHHLDEHSKTFLRHSPFAVISTSSADGSCDSSPRGDGPGFVHILDAKNLVLPERMGNKRMDSMRNLIENPKIGLLFMIPGLDETLRINGSAQIIKDPSLMQKMEEKGHVPNVGILITVDECYIHCAKALKRSHLWHPEQWPDVSRVSNPAKMMASHAKLDDLDEAKVQEALNESYTQRLY